MAPIVDSKNQLTERERELMALAWLCFSEKPKVDYKKLASLAGMTNPVSASNAWAKIQKKITAQVGDVSANGTPEAPTTKATPGKKRAAKAADDGESPTKKTKKAVAKKVKDEPVEDGEGVVADGFAPGGNSHGTEGEAEQSYF